MCGITGVFAFNLVGKFNKIHITDATMSMERRGPDFQDIYIDEWIGLGHRRLSIIDLSPEAHQPMWDASGRYCIVFNGEIFNYQELRQELEKSGCTFRSQSDTEVLLQLFIRQGEKCLSRLNGFFAFCVYDRAEQSFFLARDRYGVKPLLYLFDEDKFVFASEMKTILRYGIDRTLDFASLVTYLQLSYIPGPASIFKSVSKLLPGHWLRVSRGKMTSGKWYEIPYDASCVAANSISFEDAAKRFSELLERAVQRRMIADVPLGCFLSGGVDSSIVTGLAARHKPNLHTFSIGFRDEKFFDETRYARALARHFKTEHTVFSLSNNDLYDHVESILNHIDEPFADSSAINVYILSKETRRHATVALSGDGADELLAGYNKHEALQRMLHPGWKERAVIALSPVWRGLPQSRNNYVANTIRQAHRFATGAVLPPAERYWQWASLTNVDRATKFLTPAAQEHLAVQDLEKRKARALRHLAAGHTMNEVLLTDMELVLANDMLVKTDLMSMAHGLEIRSPFLDHELVDFCFTLPENFKIFGGKRKRLLRQAFGDILPEEINRRRKKGFEVPMLKWLRKEMKGIILDDLLSRSRIEEQGVFEYREVEKLTRSLFSSNPGDAHAHIWSLVVFQWWAKRYGVM